MWTDVSCTATANTAQLAHDGTHNYMIHQFCIKQTLELSLSCICSKCFIGPVFCFFVKYMGNISEQRIDINFLLKLEKNTTDIYELLTKFMDRENTAEKTRFCVG